MSEETQSTQTGTQVLPSEQDGVAAAMDRAMDLAERGIDPDSPQAKQEIVDDGIEDLTFSDTEVRIPVSKEGAEEDGDEVDSTVAETATAPKPAQIDPYLMQKAQQYGIDAAGLGQAELGRVLAATEAAIAKAQVQDTPAEEDKGLVLPKPEIPKEVLDNMDPDTRAAFELLQDQRRQEQEAVKEYLKSLKSEQKQTAQMTREELARTKLDELDAACKKHEEILPLIGDGPSVVMTPTSEGFENRDRLFRAVAVIDAGRQANGLPPLPRDTAIAQAIAIEFPDVVREQAQKRIKDKVKKQEKNLSVRPSSRGRQSESDLPPFEAYKQRVQAIYEKKGKPIPW